MTDENPAYQAVIDCIIALRVAHRGVASALTRSRGQCRLAVVKGERVQGISRLMDRHVEALIATFNRVSLRDPGLEGVLCCPVEATIAALEHLNQAKHYLKDAVLTLRGLKGKSAFETEFVDKSFRRGSVQEAMRETGAASFNLTQCYRQVHLFKEPVGRVHFGWANTQFRIRKIGVPDLETLLDRQRGPDCALPPSLQQVADTLANDPDQAFRLVRPIKRQRRVQVRVDHDTGSRFHPLVGSSVIVLCQSMLPEQIGAAETPEAPEDTSREPPPDRYRPISGKLGIYALREQNAQ